MTIGARHTALRTGKIRPGASGRCRRLRQLSRESICLRRYRKPGGELVR